MFERLEGMGAGAAMSLKANHYYTFVGHIYVFHIAAILLEIGSDLVEGVLYAFFNDGFLLVGHDVIDIMD